MAAAASRAARTLESPDEPLAPTAQYKVTRLCEALYPAPGGILDWMYNNGGSGGGAKHSFAVHLRDTGTYGYALPPAQIRAVGREVGAMVSSLAAFIKRGKEERW